MSRQLAMPTSKVSSHISQYVPAFVRDQLGRRLRNADDVHAQTWRACAAQSRSDHEEKLASYLVDLVCRSGKNRKHVVMGIYRIWIEANFHSGIAYALMPAMLKIDGTPALRRRNLTPRLGKNFKTGPSDLTGRDPVLWFA